MLWGRRLRALPLVLVAVIVDLWRSPAADAMTADEASRWHQAGQAVIAIAASVNDAMQASPAQTADEAFDLVARTRRLYEDLTRRSLAQPVAPAKKTARVLHAADVRRIPDKNAPRFAVAAKGSLAVVLEERPPWVRVRFDNGAVGWVESNALTWTPMVSDGDDLVTVAMQHRGVPYLWGGVSRGGVDCSGLVVRVLRAAGINPPRTAEGQFQLGVPVSRDQLQAGDLVFFQNTYRRGISHVGIYIANDRFIHASSGRGQVTVGNLTSPYYRRHYAGARRIAAAAHAAPWVRQLASSHP